MFIILLVIAASTGGFGPRHPKDNVGRSNRRNKELKHFTRFNPAGDFDNDPFDVEVGDNDFYFDTIHPNIGADYLAPSEGTVYLYRTVA